MCTLRSAVTECSFVHVNRAQSWILDNLSVFALKHLTVPSVLYVTHTNHICLNVLLHQLAAINTSPLSTCVFRSSIWVALSEICSCSVRTSAGSLKASQWVVVPGGSLCVSAATHRIFFQYQCLTYQSESFSIFLSCFEKTIVHSLPWKTFHYLGAVCVIVSDCFALSFSSSLDELRDCPVQIGRAVVIIAVLPDSPDSEQDIDWLSLSMQSSSLKGTLEGWQCQLREERRKELIKTKSKRSGGLGGLRVWCKILTYKWWISGCMCKFWWVSYMQLNGCSAHARSVFVAVIMFCLHSTCK